MSRWLGGGGGGSDVVAWEEGDYATLHRPLIGPKGAKRRLMLELLLTLCRQVQQGPTQHQGETEKWKKK